MRQHIGIVQATTILISQKAFIEIPSRAVESAGMSMLASLGTFIY